MSAKFQTQRSLLLANSPQGILLSMQSDIIGLGEIPLLTSPEKLYCPSWYEPQHLNNLPRGGKEQAMTPRPHSMFEEILIMPR